MELTGLINNMKYKSAIITGRGGPESLQVIEIGYFWW
jgi:hypothetical protein